MKIAAVSARQRVSKALTCFAHSVHQELITVRLAQVQELMRCLTVQTLLVFEAPRSIGCSDCFQHLCSDML